MNYPKDKHGLYLDPRGELVGTFAQLMEAGCIQAEVPQLLLIFHGLMMLTANNPCAGCPVWGRKGPECKAFQQYHSSYTRAIETAAKVVKEATTPNNVPPGHPLFGLSVRQIAEKLNTSIGEVRRRKTTGAL